MNTIIEIRKESGLPSYAQLKERVCQTLLLKTWFVLLTLFLLMFQTMAFAVLVTEGSKLPDAADTSKGKETKKNPPQDKSSEQKKDGLSSGVMILIKDEKLPAPAQTANPAPAAPAVSSGPALLTNSPTVVTQSSIQGATSAAAKK